MTGILAGVVAHARGYGECGWFTRGVLFAVLDLILAAVMPMNDEALPKRALNSGTSQLCPECAEVIRVVAHKRRSCNTEQPAT